MCVLGGGGRAAGREARTHAEPREREGDTHVRNTTQRHFVMPRVCGKFCATPGCVFPDFHSGACSHLMNIGHRKPKPKRPLSPEPEPRQCSEQGKRKASRVAPQHDDQGNMKGKGKGKERVSWETLMMESSSGRWSPPVDWSSHMLWVQCDRCSEWRELPQADATELDDNSIWLCEMHPDEDVRAACASVALTRCFKAKPTLERPPLDSDSGAGGSSSAGTEATSACDRHTDSEKEEPSEVQLYTVERVIAERRGKHGLREYKVHWNGYSEEHDSWEPASNLHASLVSEFEELRAAEQAQKQETDTVRIPYPRLFPTLRPATWAFVADCPSLEGRGLFARAALQPGQAIAEYYGPRMAGKAKIEDGAFALKVPGADRIVIDGNCDNSPFAVPRSPAVFANHSARPNACLQHWPALRATSSPFEVAGCMWLVAKEHIPAGCEIRIDYESGSKPGKYWCGESPQEDEWREVRKPVDHLRVPDKASPAIDVLPALLKANQGAPKRLPAAIEAGLDDIYLQPDRPLPVEETDLRIQRLAPLLLPPRAQQPGLESAAPEGRTDCRRYWGVLATHIPGLSGLQVYRRWRKQQFGKSKVDETPRVPPLKAGRLKGRWVLIPKSEWPDYECKQYDGAGWRATVLSEAGGAANVRCQGQTWYFPVASVVTWTALR